MAVPLTAWIVKDPREWPRCLSDEELEQEWLAAQEAADHAPVSHRMLRAERARRAEEKDRRCP
jgi:hypothetical protein